MQAVSLVALTGVASYLKIVYFAMVIVMVLFGIFTLVLQNYRGVFWMQNKRVISLILNILGVFLFTISSQPYAAAFLLLFLAIKGILLLKKQ